LGHKARWEYFRAVYERYRQAGREAKQVMLNEFCLNTGYHRKYAIRLLKRTCSGKTSPTAAPRTAAALRVASTVGASGDLGSRGISLVDTAEGLATELDALDPQTLLGKPRDGETAAGHQCAANGPAVKGEEERAQTADLRTHPAGLSAEAPHPGEDRQLGRDHTRVQRDRPGSPLREFGARGVRPFPKPYRHPHRLDGDARGAGESEVRVQQALDEIAGVLPFPLLGVDSDNGSEFINWHLKKWCEQKQIQLTRGRPYKKDDNAHVEQKNWTHVRKLLGWERYDSPVAVQALNDLYWNELRLWLNLYLPSVKLVKKIRVGSKVRRVYDAAQTPLERVLKSTPVKPESLTELKRLRQCLDPFQLGKVIDQKLQRIYDLANRRLSPKATAESRSAQAKEKAQHNRPNGCGKACKSRKQCAIRTFPQPRRRRVSGYSFNVSTGSTAVTFLDVLTRGGGDEQSAPRFGKETGCFTTRFSPTRAITMSRSRVRHAAISTQLTADQLEIRARGGDSNPRSPA
jgi:hypothetical protein